jgi:3',5'-cyclic AMP phosphodiesterase CpdA
MPLIRILHASDLHISTRPDVIGAPDYISAGMYVDLLKAEAVVSSYSPDILYHLAEFLYEDYTDNFVGHAAAPVDAVLLTGDIATTGLSSDLQLAFKAADGPALHSDALMWAPDNPTLAGSTGRMKIPLWLLPGNHDRLRAHPIYWYAPGGYMFDTIFEPYWGPLDTHTKLGPKVREYGEIRRLGLSVVILAADFTLKSIDHRSGLMFYNQWAQGRVYPEILDELVQKTLDAKRRIRGPLAVLWAIHFPPKFPRLPQAMQLINEQDLIDAAARCGVSAMLAGHTHEPVWYRTPGSSCDVFCSGTTTQKHAPSGHYFHILNITADPHHGIVISPENYQFDPVYREFIAV